MNYVVIAFVLAIAACDGAHRLHPPSPDATIDGAQAGIDAAPDGPTITCMLIPQGGCGSGEACDLEPDGSTACRAVSAQGAEGSHCFEDTACKAGFTCMHDGANTPWCTRLCLVDSDCADSGDGSRCVLDIDHHASGCSLSCLPYQQMGCPSGMGCVAFDDFARDYTDCRYMGNTPDGSACSRDEDCKRGSWCITTGSTSECESICQYPDNGSCDTGGTCGELAPPIIVYSIEFGGCH